MCCLLFVVSGYLAPPCGPVGLFSSCEAVGRGVPFAADAVLHAQQCINSDKGRSEGRGRKRVRGRKLLEEENTSSSDDRSSSTANATRARGLRDISNNVYNIYSSDLSESRDNSVSTDTCPYVKYDRVFAMAQYDDTQIGQFMQESLPRLVYHLDFLLANPDIKIQFGFTKKPILPTSVLPHTYFTFLGEINCLRDSILFCDIDSMNTFRHSNHILFVYVDILTCLNLSLLSIFTMT